MAQVKRLVLDILKPHQPNALEFSQHLAAQGNHRVKLTVLEMDDTGGEGPGRPTSEGRGPDGPGGEGGRRPPRLCLHRRQLSWLRG